MPQDHLELAKVCKCVAVASTTIDGVRACIQDLTKTCYEMYARQPAKLAPEIAHFNDRTLSASFTLVHPLTLQTDESNDMYVKPADAHNLLRPETVESLFIMWRITKVGVPDHQRVLFPCMHTLVPYSISMHACLPSSCFLSGSHLSGMGMEHLPGFREALPRCLGRLLVA